MRVNQGRAIAKSNMRRRMRHLERGGTPACPERCPVWTQGILPRGEEDQPLEEARRLFPSQPDDRSYRNLSRVPLHPERTL